MKTTYIVNRTSETTATVETISDGRLTTLFARFDTAATNMSGQRGAWSGHYPCCANELAALAMSIPTGTSAELSKGQVDKPFPPRACPENANKAAAWDLMYNEGGEGYNPYR